MCVRDEVGEGLMVTVRAMVMRRAEVRHDDDDRVRIWVGVRGRNKHPI